MLSVSATRIETTSRITNPSSQPYIFFEKNREKLCEMIKTLETDPIERLKSIEWFKNNFKDDFNELRDLCDQAVEVVKMVRKNGTTWSHDYTTSLKRNVPTNPNELWAMYGQSSHPTLAKLRIKIVNFMIPISNSGKIILILIVQDFLNKFLPIIDSNDINHIMISNLRSVLYNILNNDEYRDIIMKNGELIEIKAGFWNSDSFKRVCLNNTTHRTFKEFVECPCDHYREFQWYTHDSIMQSYLYSIEEIILIRKLTGYTQVHPSEKHFSLQQPRKISIGRSRENDLCFLYGQCVHRKHGNFIVEKSRVIYKSNHITWIKHANMCGNKSDECGDCGDCSEILNKKKKLYDFEKIMKNMGFYQASNDGEVIKKGTQIAFLRNYSFFITVDIDRIIEQIINKCHEDEIQPEIIFEFVKKYNIKITLEDVTCIWSHWNYDLENTVRVILREIKEQVFDIFIINIDTLTL